MQEQAGWGARFGDKGQLYYYLALVAVVLLAVGLLVFVMLALLPAWRLTTALHADLKLAQENLELRERIQADAPRQAQQQVSAAEAQQTAAAGRFLHEETAGLALDRLYAYGAAAGVEVVDLQSQPVAGGEVFTQRSYALRAVGEWDQLLDFLARLEEAAQPLCAGCDNGGGRGSHDDGDFHDRRPLATTTDSLAEQRLGERGHAGGTTAGAGPRQSGGARGALSRVCQPGLPPAGAASQARIQFESALQVKPGGQEAQLELQQIDANALAIFAAEDRLARALQTASAAGEWQEVIRLLRLIQTINPEYPDLEAQLRQAYINYGDQLAAQGQAEAAEEQYKQAELLPAP
jgi:hypothetical protein